MPKRPLKKRLLIILLLATSLGIALFILTEIAIVYDGFTDEIFPADAALILGSTVFPDGSLSDRLRARLNRGLKLYEDGFVPHIVVSGGLGKEGHWEGSAMAAYLTAQGVPETAVTIDNEGNNTYQSARNFVTIAETRQMESVIVVSQFFHISRTRLILGKLGVTRIGAAHSTLYTRRDIYSTLREFPAYVKYALVY